jgi:hypothetical protein
MCNNYFFVFYACLFLQPLFIINYQFVIFVSVGCFFWHIKYVGLQNLIQRNEQLYGSGNTPSGGVALPFILVQVNTFLVLCSVAFVHNALNESEFDLLLHMV